MFPSDYWVQYYGRTVEVMEATGQLKMNVSHLKDSIQSDRLAAALNGTV